MKKLKIKFQVISLTVFMTKDNLTKDFFCQNTKLLICFNPLINLNEFTKKADLAQIILPIVLYIHPKNEQNRYSCFIEISKYYIFLDLLIPYNM